MPSSPAKFLSASPSVAEPAQLPSELGKPALVNEWAGRSDFQIFYVAGVFSMAFRVEGEGEDDDVVRGGW